MTTVIAVILLVVGLVVLIAGADALIRGAAQLAKHMGLSPFAIGVTVVAFGTSAPELFASIGAALNGQPDLAIGNVIGSNIANIVLILGVGGLLMVIEVSKKVRFVEIPIMVAVTVGTMVMLLDASLTRLEGGVLVGGLIAYVLYIIRAHKDSITDELEDTVGETKSIGMDLVYVVLGSVGLAIGARVLVMGATDLATQIGIPAGIIGTTIVAFGTSVPELAATIRAASAKHSDMAVGNIVGSNVFNLLSVLGITSLIHPLGMSDGMGVHMYTMLGVALLLTLWVFVRPVISKLGGVVFLVVYAGYVVFAYAMNPTQS